MTVILKDKKPLVVPGAVWRKAGLRHGDQIEFKVSGRVINIVPTAPLVEPEYSLKAVTKVIEEAKKKPMDEAKLRAENKRLMAYGARQAKKVGLKERDIPRVIHESRSRRFTP